MITLKQKEFVLIKRPCEPIVRRISLVAKSLNESNMFSA
jgi:hypothetical protein